MPECHLCGVEDHLSDLEVCQLCECLTCEDCGCFREERDGDPVGFYCDDCVEEPAASERRGALKKPARNFNGRRVVKRNCNGARAMNVDEAMKTAGSGILCFRGHAAVSVLSAEVERLRAGAETQNAAIKILNGMIHDLQTELAAAKAASAVPVGEKRWIGYVN